MISDNFNIIHGSIIGTIHRETYKNNQDAVYVSGNNDGFVAMVCDGCSGGRHNETGAKIMARFISRQLFKNIVNINHNEDIEKIFEKIRLKAIKFMKLIIDNIDGNKQSNIANMFLYTIIGAIVTERISIIFRIGDGAFALNGEIKLIDSNNEPDYIGYGLIEDMKTPNFIIEKVVETQSVENIMLSTDGIRYLIENASKTLKDGSIAGNYDQFITDDKYIKNISLLQKRLAVLGPINGILKDDTSIIIIKRTHKEAIKEV